MNQEGAAASASPPPKKATGCLPYIIGGASFIPLVGVLFGLVSIIWGGINRMWVLVGAGIAGILFTVVLYGSLFYFGFVQRGGVYDKLRGQQAIPTLNSTVKEIEYYKMQNGHYPRTLKEIAAAGTFVGIDPMKAFRMGDAKNGDIYFYYELTTDGTHYFLRSVGSDGIPFTADDIVPSILDSERRKTGLLLQKGEANHSPEPTPGTVH